MSRHFDDIVAWLIASNSEYSDLRSLTGELVSRLNEAGVPVHRFNLGVFAVHPEMAGYAVVWEQGMVGGRVRHGNLMLGVTLFGGV